MLPFDNKSDFLVVANQPNDAPLEATQEALQEFGRFLTTVNEVDSVVTYAGVSAPIDFNGLVRHYYLNQGPYVGQLRVNLAEKERRRAASHAIALWLRPKLTEIARQHQTRLAIAEVPPGPPVLQTLVGEVYGPPGAAYSGLIQEADKVKEFFLKTPGVVDVDTTVATAEPRFRFLVDRDKAALSGLAAAQIARGVATAQAGETVGRVHLDCRTPAPGPPAALAGRGPLLHPRPGPALF